MTRAGAVPGRLLPRSFYEDRSETVGSRLLGKLLVHRSRDAMLVGRIVEVEAYLGPHHETPDPAAHSHRGPTARNMVLFGVAGHAYVYSIYGRYFCMNVSCEKKDLAGCVLIRALEPIAGIDRMAMNRNLPWTGPLTDRIARQLTSGPSRLCQAMDIMRSSHNGLDLTGEASMFQIRDDGFVVREAMATPRIGISEAVDLPLRYVIPGHPCLSGNKSLSGKRIFIP